MKAVKRKAPDAAAGLTTGKPWDYSKIFLIKLRKQAKKSDEVKLFKQRVLFFPPPKYIVLNN
jgi:hypothetical protein